MSDAGAPLSWAAVRAPRIGAVTPTRSRTHASATSTVSLASARSSSTVGNGCGGSGSNSSHLCEDLGKSTLDRNDFTNDAVKRLKVLSLTDNTPYILAWANDEGFERVSIRFTGDLPPTAELHPDANRGVLRIWFPETSPTGASRL